MSVILFVLDTADGEPPESGFRFLISLLDVFVGGSKVERFPIFRVFLFFHFFSPDFTLPNHKNVVVVDFLPSVGFEASYGPQTGTIRKSTSY